MSGFVKAAVLGHPVAHSLSPRMHQYWIEKYGLQGSYEAIDVPCEHLAAALPQLVQQNYRGFNLTLPHKEAALALCDTVDDQARAVGAVNTVTVEGGKLHGTNTDVFGFTENIKAARPDFDFAAGPAVVLGAGGAARAAVYGLLQEGAAEIVLVNRTLERAETLAKSSENPRKIKALPWAERGAALENAALLVNTTALGMAGQEGLEINLAALPQTALVCDIVYRPLMTDLLQAAQTRGNPIVTGIGMLLHQARPAFAAWFGVMPEIDAGLLEGLGL